MWLGESQGIYWREAEPEVVNWPAMVRTDVWNKAVGEAWEIGFGGGWKE